MKLLRNILRAIEIRTLFYMYTKQCFYPTFFFFFFNDKLVDKGTLHETSGKLFFHPTDTSC